MTENEPANTPSTYAWPKMASSIAKDPDIRSSRLAKFFHDVLNGKRDIQTSSNGKLFIEAICGQADPATCAHKLLTSTLGLTAVQSAVRLDTSVSFINENTTLLLQYLQEPSLKGIDSGSVLVRILTSMVNPPFFWDAFVSAFRGHFLSLESSRAFTWLLSQLVCFPTDSSIPYVVLAKSHDIQDLILNSPDGETRILGQKIKHTLSLNVSDLQVDSGIKAGGRHDNDFSDHRKISIMPTADELLSRERPFLRMADFADDIELSQPLQGLHIDNQFRLLREDMLGDIRTEIQIITGVVKGRHKGLTVDNLRLLGVDMAIDKNGRRPWGIVLQAANELPQLKNIAPSKRKAHLVDNKHILRHGNMACLLIDGEPVAFPMIHRNEEELSKAPANLIVQFQDDSTLSYALSKLKIGTNIKLVQLDTAVFAFEPFLKRLQELKELPLSDELLHWKEGDVMMPPSFEPVQMINDLIKKTGEDLQQLVGTGKSVKLDRSQMKSLCASLSQRVALVQGPPGTGKSFIGALTAKILFDHTKQVILVVCFTNHALDQFLEDLMDIGIASSSMIRLGGKSTDRTKPLTIREQAGSKLTPSQWDQINKAQVRLEENGRKLRNAFAQYKANTTKESILDFLEFSDEELPFSDAFSVPTNNDGEVVVGKKGRAVSKFYLLDRWTRNEKDAGAFSHLLPRGASAVWKLAGEVRAAHQARWQAAIRSDLIVEVERIGRQFNEDEAEIKHILGQRDTNVIKTKRIIACTTNGAAKFSRAIQAAYPGVVLVEEAGEILESHILTALGPNTEQLILIGDHQQLRPKCSYELGVDGGSGYDLDRSLFERLVLKGFPHTTLTQQHRMRPEISSIIRHMTYPDLTDATTTLNRDDLRGFQSNLMFVNHSELEIEVRESKESRDGNSTSSKQNLFEASMVLKCVRYLAQQGYGSDQIVVLTPYLGQLKLLRDELSRENDPILNDLDRFDLLRAGLLSDLSSKSSKPSLRLSTIDNYQGEESDIVIGSLTRSNTSKDIGFMKSPERLNVLVSRARNGLILIGNSETFIHARKGGSLWRKFFDHLKENDHVYEGFPARCEKHPDRVALLSSPDDFDLQCPDGGCKEPCEITLNCGIHNCPSRCHQLFDHSKIKCVVVLQQKCSNGHPQTWQCHQKAAGSCQKCEREKREAEKRIQKAAEIQQRRNETIQKHLIKVAKLQADIDLVTQSMKDARLDTEQENVLKQMRKDLAAAQEMVNRPKQESQVPQASAAASTSRNVPIQSPHSKDKTKKPDQVPAASKPRDKNQSLQDHLEECLVHNVSASKTEWQRQRDQENAVNPAIDKIMEMIGLENVKSQVLRIKSKVETSVRQGTDLKKERLGLVLLGNPGTGKTTIARYYSDFLISLQVLSGNGFVETTGSRLGHGGIAEVKNHIKILEAAEGGVYFIDEAYQLTEGHNYGGKTVLDFLLAEIENLVGKVVFVFAGYRKQMEKFFEHNPGLESRIPYNLHFEDYTDAELLSMLQFQIGKFYSAPMNIEGGIGGLFMRIVVRRLGRGRGSEGFGNARALENVFSHIRERQSDRLTRERRDGLNPADDFISKEDLIGPDPSQALLQCEAWTKLQKLTGLKTVKTSINSMIDLINTNYERELQEKPLIEVSLNRVFLGSPGTGKTSVARLYGRILADIGMLSNGQVVIKNPADFIGSAIGQSEANTKAILAITVGKVLIIDEAYMLYSGSGGGGGAGATDIYKTAVIDTIVAEIQSVPGEDRCVLLLGYEDQMIEMFRNVNPGLTRRFQLSDAFHFDDFSDAELQEIMESKLKTQGLGATDKAISVAIDCLSRLRNGLNFGNGGDVENIISKAKSAYQARQSKLPATERSIDFLFEPQDFDPDFDRASDAETNLEELFKDVVGCESIVAKLDGFLKVAKGMRAQGLDPRGQIPMNFIFKGPPGSGKTTTARKLGQVFYDLGFLSHVEVVECSATDLIGSYVGQTGPKTNKQLERGLGKVLFIDEAYRLGEGLFAQEAVNELVDTVTKPKFAGKLVIILAGYDKDMNNLLTCNEGLSSRFADEIHFPALGPDYCLELLVTRVQQSKISVTLSDPRFRVLMTELAGLPGWGNARDVQTLAKSMVRSVFQNNTTGSQLVLSDELAFNCMESMLDDRRKRSTVTQSSLPSLGLGLAQQFAAPQVIPQTNLNTSMATKVVHEESSPVEEALTPSPMVVAEPERDAGVSDTIWANLNYWKEASIIKSKLQEKELKDREEGLRAAEKAGQQLVAEVMALQESQAKTEAKANERLRKREEARIKELDEGAEEVENQRTAEMVALMAKQAEEEARADERLRVKQARYEAKANELLRKREEARIRELDARASRDAVKQEVEREAQVQTKLRHMGVCSAGYHWIKQSDGYICAGGSHSVSAGQLGM